MKPCPWCGGDDATTTLDGQPACDGCARPVVSDGLLCPNMRVFRLIEREPGLISQDIGDALDLPEAGLSEEAEKERNLLSARLTRMLKAGAIRVDGVGSGRRYYAEDVSKLPRLHAKYDRKARPKPRRKIHVGLQLSPRDRICKRCPAGLLPEWGDMCPECVDDLAAGIKRKKRALEYNAKRRKDWLEGKAA